MPDIREKLADSIIRAKAFNPAFYRNTYPDVDLTGMDPALHYRRYGVLMRRAPGPELAADPALLADHLPAPRASQVLRMAARFAVQYGDDVGVRYAQTHVAPDAAYTVETLRANRALAAGDRAGWMAHLNRYIAHFGAAPVTWTEGAGTHLIDRFSCDGLTPVTGGPLVSVIMPAWNAEGTIAAAARSVLNQTWRNLELLIVDDASSDGTWGQMQQIAAGDSRVRILRGRVNAGPYVAKNIALTMARGEWITGHDADDWAHPQRIEQHMSAILSAPAPPRASVPQMVRLNPEGRVVRFGNVSPHSPDGVTRLCPIATTFHSAFLRDTLGGWDCVRFGADSELMARTELLIDSEYTRFGTFAMICIEMETSLTAHPTLGIGEQGNVSPARRLYRENFEKWHASIDLTDRLAARMPFPPELSQSRPFEIAEESQVPDHVARRNHAAITGQDTAFHQPVTVICYLPDEAGASSLATQVGQQTLSKVRLICMAGDGLARISAVLDGLPDVQVIAAPQDNTGAALNIALDACQTDFVALFRAGDHYGPNHLQGLLAALRHGEGSAALVGRAGGFAYDPDDNNMSAILTAGEAAPVLIETALWSRSALGDPRFMLPQDDLPRDILLTDLISRDTQIAVAEPFDYVRHGPTRENETVTPLAAGLRLDLTYSDQRAPDTTSTREAP